VGLSLKNLNDKKEGAETDCASIFKEGQTDEAAQFKTDLAGRHDAAVKFVQEIKVTAETYRARIQASATATEARGIAAEIHAQQSKLTGAPLRSFSQLLQTLGRQKAAAARKKTKADKDAKHEAEQGADGEAAVKAIPALTTIVLSLLQAAL